MPTAIRLPVAVVVALAVLMAALITVLALRTGTHPAAAYFHPAMHYYE